MRHSRLKRLMLALTVLLPGQALAEDLVLQVRSVKALTHLMDQIEQENGDRARFVTMKLQLFLEDVYLSQGTTVFIEPARLSRAIDDLMRQGYSKREAGRLIVRRYQDGEFHD